MRSSLQFFILLTLLFIQNITESQTLRHKISFAQPQIIEHKSGFSEVLVDQCINTGDEGLPLLPHYPVNILLPQGTELSEVRIISVTYYDPYIGVDIIPAARPFPFSEPAPDNYRVTPDPEVYQKPGPYPESPITETSTHFLAGYSIGVFSIIPIRYFPLKSTVEVIKEIEFEVVPKISSYQPVIPAFQHHQNLERIKHLTVNPWLVEEYQFPDIHRTEQIDLLIITNQALAQAFQAYAQYKTSRGFSTLIVTTQEIQSSFTGKDLQEKIRNCIRHYYQNNGLQYVILGGDSDPQNPAHRIIPHRGFFVNTGFGTVDEDIPSDLYYACLDGSWDANDNGKYGEPGEEDLFAEVIVGRMCVDQPSEVQNMSLKLMKYQDTPVIADITKALMLGEQLDSSTWGDYYKEEIASGSSNNGYTTTGFPGYFNISRLYDLTSPWNKQDVFNKFNQSGINLLNHLGHSYVDYNMKMYLSDLTINNFQNDGVNRGYVIGYSQGCYNGSLDNRGSSANYFSADCFAERITTMETGMVAAIANSRFGWYQQNGTNGPSQIFDRKFFDALFGQEILQIGLTNQASKEDVAPLIMTNRVIRWCAYELNLFGDPSMNIWTKIPSPITATYPDIIPIGIASILIETNTPDARIGIMQDGNLIGKGFTDSNGQVEIVFNSIISSPSPITISISAPNKLLHVGTITVNANIPYVIAEYYQLNDQNGNGNQIPEYGEEILLGVSMKNIGNVEAAGVHVTLFTLSNHLNIPYQSIYLGNLAGGQSVFIPDAFHFSIAANIPDQHTAMLLFNATGQTSWISALNLTVNAPLLKIPELQIDDSETGNNNGNLDQGEWVVFRFPVINDGHAFSADLQVEFTSNNDNVLIPNTQATASGLLPGATYLFSFQGYVNPEAQMGDPAVLKVKLNSGQYQVITKFNFKIGMIIENFELGDFSLINWEFAGNQPWIITSTDPYEGLYCARSGLISHDQTSELKVKVFVASQDTISFFRKVSSETDKDFLSFYDGGILRGKWSGNQGWEKVVFVVHPGYHEFRWVYEKNATLSQGDDCGWIDYIRFPRLLQSHLSAGADDMVCAGSDYQTKSSGIYLLSIQWSTSGDGSFNDPSILQPIYSPGPADIQNGSVILTVTAISANNQTLSDSMTLAIVHDPPVPAKPTGDTQVCTNTGLSYQYTTENLPEIRAYIWELIPSEAGIISGTSHKVDIQWTPDYTGTVLLHVKGVNVCGESAFSESLIIMAEPCSGLPETKNFELEIYPNPSSGKVYVRHNKHSTAHTIRIFNHTGLQTAEFQADHNSGNTLLDLSDLKEGIYYITIDGLPIVRKLVLIKQ